LKLIANRHVIKRDDLHYAPAVLTKLEKSGNPLPSKAIPEVKHRQGGSAWFVLRVLEKSPLGLAAHEIKDALSAESDAPASLQKHSQFIYNVLGTLVGAGSVIKKDGKYFLAKGESKPGTNGSGLVAHA
jgi:hypothetical protein